MLQTFPSHCPMAELHQRSSSFLSPFKQSLLSSSPAVAWLLVFLNQSPCASEITEAKERSRSFRGLVSLVLSLYLPPFLSPSLSLSLFLSASASYMKMVLMRIQGVYVLLWTIPPIRNQFFQPYLPVFLKGRLHMSCVSTIHTYTHTLVLTCTFWHAISVQKQTR